jgi:hypothetical protein
VQGKVGILHQARLDIMRPSDDPQQSRISQCLVFGVLHQHLHFAADTLQPRFHLQR